MTERNDDIDQRIDRALQLLGVTKEASDAMIIAAARRKTIKRKQPSRWSCKYKNCNFSAADTDCGFAKVEEHERGCVFALLVKTPASLCAPCAQDTL